MAVIFRMWGQVSVKVSDYPGHLSGAGHDEWDQGAYQALAWVGACSTCQVLLCKTTALVRSLFM